MSESLNSIVSCNSDGHALSYLAELCKIAVNSRSLSALTWTRLRKATILVGSRHTRRRESDEATDLIDEEAWDLEYNLLSPDQVVIADNMIIFQQFSEELFCAPQEDILEGENNSMCLP